MVQWKTKLTFHKSNVLWSKISIPLFTKELPCDCVKLTHSLYIDRAVQHLALPEHQVYDGVATGHDGWVIEAVTGWGADLGIVGC